MADLSERKTEFGGEGGEIVQTESSNIQSESEDHFLRLKDARDHLLKRNKDSYLD